MRVIVWNIGLCPLCPANIMCAVRVSAGYKPRWAHRLKVYVPNAQYLAQSVRRVNTETREYRCMPRNGIEIPRPHPFSALNDKSGNVGHIETKWLVGF